MDRRTFIQSASAAAWQRRYRLLPQWPSRSSKMIGLQVGAVSFVDEGVEKALDEFQTDAAINTLFVATFTYGRGIARRQVPAKPFPDHGKQAGRHRHLPGGCYTEVNPKYFADTVFKDFRAPDLGKYDVLKQVMPSARKRGMKTICWFEDVFRRDLPDIQQLEEEATSRAKQPSTSASTIRTTATGSSESPRTGRGPTISTASCGDRSGMAQSRTCSAPAMAARKAERYLLLPILLSEARKPKASIPIAQAGFLELETFVCRVACRPAPRRRLLRNCGA